MSKDDYHVIVFKILLYFYGCLKRDIAYQDETFDAAIGDINRDYLHDVLLMMQDSGYISGIHSLKAWGTEAIITSEYADIKITEKGIDYLTQNSTMAKVKAYFNQLSGLIPSLIKIVL